MGNNRQSGVSLIEVLVSLVILSLGVLSVVGLQLVSKRNNADAGQRTIAAQLAYDIIERMRANCFPATLAAYLTDGSPAPLGDESQGLLNPGCDAANCDSTQLATYDLWQWEQSLAGAAEQVAGANVGGLLLPTGCISGPAAGGDGTYIITIVWRGKVGIPDSNPGAPADATAVGCGRDTEDASGKPAYSQDGTTDQAFRRSVSVPAFITARQAT